MGLWGTLVKDISGVLNMVMKKTKTKTNHSRRSCRPRTPAQRGIEIRGKGKRTAARAVKVSRRRNPALTLAVPHGSASSVLHLRRQGTPPVAVVHGWFDGGTPGLLLPMIGDDWDRTNVRGGRGNEMAGSEEIASSEKWQCAPWAAFRRLFGAATPPNFLRSLHLPARDSATGGRSHEMAGDVMHRAAVREWRCAAWAAFRRLSVRLRRQVFFSAYICSARHRGRALPRRWGRWGGTCGTARVRTGSAPALTQSSAQRSFYPSLLSQFPSLRGCGGSSPCGCDLSSSFSSSSSPLPSTIFNTAPKFSDEHLDEMRKKSSLVSVLNRSDWQNINLFALYAASTGKRSM